MIEAQFATGTTHAMRMFSGCCACAVALSPISAAAKPAAKIVDGRIPSSPRFLLSAFSLLADSWKPTASFVKRGQARRLWAGLRLRQQVKEARRVPASAAALLHA